MVNKNVWAVVSGLLLLAMTAQAETVKVKDLPGEIKDVLTRDAECDQGNGQSAANSDESSVETTMIRGSKGDAGIIVGLQEGCRCQNGNCPKYVFLKSGDKYELAFSDKFVALRPSKVIKRGMPSLSGRAQTGPDRAETTIYDWDGKKYRPTLCATLVQTKKQRFPTIAHHPCGTSTAAR